MRSHHDIGGMIAGPIDRTERAVPGWARLAEALRALIDVRYGLHEQRRRIEALGPEAYARLGYHELRVTALAQALAEKDIVAADELARRIAELGNTDGGARWPATSKTIAGRT